MHAYYLSIISKHYTPNQLIFINKSIKDERSLSRLYEYSPRNTHACKKWYLYEEKDIQFYLLLF